jgi:hypothetical protein
VLPQTTCLYNHGARTKGYAIALSKQTLIGIGANTFYYQQVTGDSGKGAVIGPNEGTDVGVGPVITLFHTTPKCNFSVQAKWLPEVYTKAPPQWQSGVSIETRIRSHADGTLAPSMSGCLSPVPETRAVGTPSHEQSQSPEGCSNIERSGFAA